MQTQLRKITTREAKLKFIRKSPPNQNFPISISCRYLVEVGPRQLGLPVEDITTFTRTISGCSKDFFGKYCDHICFVGGEAQENCASILALGLTVSEEGMRSRFVGQSSSVDVSSLCAYVFGSNLSLLFCSLRCSTNAELMFGVALPFLFFGLINNLESCFPCNLDLSMFLLKMRSFRIHNMSCS